MRGLEFQTCSAPRKPFMVLVEAMEQEHGREYVRLEICKSGQVLTYRKHSRGRRCYWTRLCKRRVEV
ncbi:MAG: hypothetical protein KAY37_01105 [Phycisphaerae bacterium]|nr:hypothetical protein [Phycisphaerae bacterium]